VEEKIRELFATLLQVAPEEVEDSTCPDTLGRWDSMQHLILVSGFEEEFDLDIDPEQAVEMYKNFAVFRRIVMKNLDLKR
jgi:acyl carrier protein